MLNMVLVVFKFSLKLISESRGKTLITRVEAFYKPLNKTSQKMDHLKKLIAKK